MKHVSSVELRKKAALIWSHGGGSGNRAAGFTETPPRATEGGSKGVSAPPLSG